MAKIGSSEKDVRRSQERGRRNSAVRSAVRTYIRRFKEVVVAGDAPGKEAAYRTAQSMIDKAVTRGVLKPRTAARYKSRLASLL